MNKIKEFFKSSCIYKMTENEMLLLQGAIVGTTMGLTLLLLGIMVNLSVPLTIGKPNDMLASTIVLLIGLVFGSIAVYRMLKNSEKI